MMTRALLAAAIMLPSIAASQETENTGSTPPAISADALTENQVRDMLAADGYTAIGTLERDSEGIWRTTAMKGINMMAITVNRDGEIEDR
ncbi:MAG: hypothetical protein KL863_09810 [Rhizobium sp.]|nr:hypothetical protein [Rhizobium sp.]